MITQASYAADGTVTAGPIEGLIWNSITPEHRFWSAVQEYVAGGGVIAPYAPPLQSPPVISRRQFFQMAAVSGDITPAEALAAVQNGAIPAPMQLFIDTLPEADQFAAQMLIAGAAEFDPAHALSMGYAMATGRTPAAKDQFFRDAGLL